MEVRMIGQLPAPGVEDAEEADLRSEMFWIKRDLLEGLGAFFKEQAVKAALIVSAQRPQLFWQRKGDQKVRHWQQLSQAPFAPGGGVCAAALRAGAMVAAVVSEVPVGALAARIEMAAEVRGAAGQDRAQGPAMMPGQLRAVTLQVSRAVTADNVR